MAFGSADAVEEGEEHCMLGLALWISFAEIEQNVLIVFRPMEEREEAEGVLVPPDGADGVEGVGVDVEGEEAGAVGGLPPGEEVAPVVANAAEGEDAQAVEFHQTGPTMKCSLSFAYIGKRPVLLGDFHQVRR